MSSDQSSPSETARVNTAFGPAVRGNQVLRPNAAIGGGSTGYNRGIRDALNTQQYGGDRDLYDALGYTKNPKFKHFEARYQRGGTAAALVDKPPRDCWGEAPTINDTADSNDDEANTTFEEEVEGFLAGGDAPWETLPDNPDPGDIGDFDSGARSDPVSVFERVDRMARLGRFSLLFVGYADDAVADADDSEAALADPVDVASLDGPDDISYLSAYDEGRVDWGTIEANHLNENPTSPRYGWPEHYLVELTEGGDPMKIHHSRVIHIVEDPFDQELLSDSALRKSLNRLDDRQKVFGGSAEAFWRSAYQGIVVQPPANTPAGQGSYTDQGEQIHEQIQNWVHNFERTIFSNGDIETLDSDIASPADHIDAYDREIAAGHDIPQSILMGNETGERATSEDRQMYHEFLGRRRRQHCENQILRPFFNQQIAFGIFTPPKGGGYDVDWPTLEEPSEKELAETRAKNAKALKDASGGEPNRIAADAEIRAELFDWGPERGSEATEGADAATAEQLEQSTQIDEADPDVQDQFEAGQGQEAIADGGGDE